MAQDKVTSGNANAEKAYSDAAKASVVSSEPALKVPAFKSAKAGAKAKPAAKPKKAVVKKAIATRKAQAAPANKPVARKAAKKIVAAKAKPLPISAPKPTNTKTSKPKENIMAKKTNEGAKKVVAGAQAKAKEAFVKSSVLLNEAGEFTKGNLQAVAESGKILAEGVKGMGATVAADSRTAFETASADVKELVTVKSPLDLIKLQSEIVRKNIDSAFKLGTKNTETMFKLAGEVTAPISGRVNLAVEKVRKAAA